MSQVISTAAVTKNTQTSATPAQVLPQTASLALPQCTAVCDITCTCEQQVLPLLQLLLLPLQLLQPLKLLGVPADKQQRVHLQ